MNRRRRRLGRCRRRADAAGRDLRLPHGAEQVQSQRAAGAQRWPRANLGGRRVQHGEAAACGRRRRVDAVGGRLVEVQRCDDGAQFVEELHERQAGEQDETLKRESKV